jgi:hypothetical protein
MTFKGFAPDPILSVYLVTKWTLNTFYLKIAGFNEHTDYVQVARRAKLSCTDSCEFGTSQ